MSATPSVPKSISKINTSRFYHEWKGHPIEDLDRFRRITLQQRPHKPIIYLAGDSSLDNKYWVPSSGPGGEGLDVEVPVIYEQALDRAKPKPDVAFWMNHLLGEKATCINAAIEETMLRERDEGLLLHDEFIRDNIREDDILILAWLTRRSSITGGTASSLPYFANLFHTCTESYINRLTSKTKPRAVIVCMIYFPLEKQYGQTSWADMQLKMLGYERDPGLLQEAIRKMYEMGTCKVKVEGTAVVPCALFEVMDGSRLKEYTARVEPSAEGGKKIAERFGELVIGMLERKASAESQPAAISEN